LLGDVFGRLSFTVAQRVVKSERDLEEAAMFGIDFCRRSTCHTTEHRCGLRLKSAVVTALWHSLFKGKTLVTLQIVLILFYGISSEAMATTYSYVGNAFNSFIGIDACPSQCYVSGEFTVPPYPVRAGRAPLI
jgi:hypothetical protein